MSCTKLCYIHISLLILSLGLLTGCAELKDQREHGSITFTSEADANARMNTIDQAYVKHWLKARHTSAEELLGKTKAEVRAVLGRGYEPKSDCGTTGNGLRAIAARHPEDANVAYQVKYWCDEDHEEWIYNIPRWFYLNGNTLCLIQFENGRVISVGNTTSKLSERPSGAGKK